jgi:hypothetical protein
VRERRTSRKLKRENQIFSKEIVRWIAAFLMVALVSFMLALYITLDTLETVLPPGSAVWFT